MKVVQEVRPNQWILAIFISIGLLSTPTKTRGQSFDKDRLFKTLEKEQKDLNDLEYLNAAAWELIEIDTALARKTALSTLQIAQKLNSSSDIALAYNRLGRLAHQAGDFDQAIIYYSRNLEIRLTAKDTVGQCNTHVNLGNSLKNMGNYQSAMEHYIKALSLLELSSKTDFALEAKLYNNLGSLYSKQGKDDEALEFYQKSLKLNKCCGSRDSYAYSCLNLGGLLVKIGQKTEGLSYLNQAYKIQKQSNDVNGMGKTLINIGNVNFEMGMFEKAIGYYQQSMEHLLSLGNKHEIARLRNNLGAAYTMLDRNDQARDQYIKGLKLSKQIQAKSQESQFYENLAYLEESIGNYRSALNWFYKHDSLSSILLNAENNKQINELQIQYDLLKKEGEMNLLKKEKSEQEMLVKQQHIKLQTTIIILLMVGLAGISLFIGFRQKQKANELLRKQKEIIADREKEKEVLLRELNHRVKNNLQIISSMLNLQSIDLKDGEALKAVKEGQNRIEALSLIHQKLYQTSLITRVDMPEYIEKLTLSIAYSFGFSANEVNIKSNIKIKTLEADTAIPIGLIINELINNSFKHAFKETQKPAISIEMNEEHSNYYLQVRDNGPGFESSNNGHKTSFGMELIRSLTKQIKGRYTIEHEKGFSITLMFPKVFTS